MSQGRNHPDPEDLFADTRMTFGEHIEELRTHLLRAIAGFVVALVASFFIGRPVLDQFIIQPVETQLQEVYDRRTNAITNQMRQETEGPATQPKWMKVAFPRGALEGKGDFDPEGPPQDLPDGQLIHAWMQLPEPSKAFVDVFGEAAKRLGPRPSMKTMHVAEAFMVYFKICIFCAVVMASPWIFWQVWLFIAAGLYPHEKRLINVYLPISIFLFLSGVAACQFIVLPRAISALLWFNEWLNLDPDLRLNEWLSFALLLPLVFGLAFQTPLVMFFLHRLGVVEIDTFRRKRAIAFFVLAVFSAVGPSIDAFSMLFMWGSLCLLYQLGIWLCVWFPRTTPFDVDVPDSEEMVEV